MDDHSISFDWLFKLLSIIVLPLTGFLGALWRNQAIDHNTVAKLDADVVQLQAMQKQTAANIASITQLVMVMESQRKNAETDGQTQWQHIEDVKRDITAIKVSLGEISGHMRTFHEAIDRRSI